MSKPFKPGLETDGPTIPTARPLPARERVLDVACELFAEAGFHGTHLREICKRAGTNVAGVCYHFHSKQGLYQAVIMEAGRQLSQPGGLIIAEDLLTREQLAKRVESLIQKLSAGEAWIAKLLARELVDVTDGARNYAAAGLERDSILIQALLRQLQGGNASREAIQLGAVHLISDCIAYSLARENPHHPLTQLTVRMPARAEFARVLTQRLLWALEREGIGSEISHS